MNLADLSPTILSFLHEFWAPVCGLIGSSGTIPLQVLRDAAAASSDFFAGNFLPGASRGRGIGAGIGTRANRGTGRTGTTRPSSLHMAFDRALQANNYEEVLRLQERLSRRDTSGNTRATRGASKAMLEKKTTKRKATALDAGDTDGQKEQCVICMEEIKEGATLKVLSCGHKFHSRCIDRWLRRKARCPVCNAQL